MAPECAAALAPRVGAAAEHGSQSEPPPGTGAGQSGGKAGPAAPAVARFLAPPGSRLVGGQGGKAKGSDAPGP